MTPASPDEQAAAPPAPAPEAPPATPPTAARRWAPAFLAPGPDGAPVPPPAGAYSPAVRAGDFVFVSGQVPRDPATGALVGDGDLATQARQTFANLRRALAAAGAELADVVSVTVHLARVSDWGAFDHVYRETFAPPYPTRTVVGAALRGILVEVTAVAYVGPAGPGRP